MSNWIGHAISMGSLMIAIFVGAMWLGSLDQKVEQLRSSTVTAERIARLEARVDTLAGNTADLKGAVSDLVRELRRNP